MGGGVYSLGRESLPKQSTKTQKPAAEDGYPEAHKTENMWMVKENRALEQNDNVGGNV